MDNTPVSKHPGYSNIELQNSTPHQNTADVAKYAEPSKGGAKNKNKYQGVSFFTYYKPTTVCIYICMHVCM